MIPYLFKSQRDGLFVVNKDETFRSRVGTTCIF